jgi:RNA polymerase sigma factor (sigma-70 family)
MPDYRTVENLLKKICRKFTNKGLDMEDLMQEARFIVWRAENKYDGSLGFAWSTYAGRVAYNELKRKLYWPSGRRRYASTRKSPEANEITGGMCPLEAAEVAEAVSKVEEFRTKRPKGQRSPIYLNDTQDKALGYLLSGETVPKPLGLAKQSAVKKLEAHLRKEIDQDIELPI